jgi:hypothetical protein
VKGSEDLAKLQKLPEKNNKNWNLAGGQSSATVLHPNLRNFSGLCKLIRNKKLPQSHLITKNSRFPADFLGLGNDKS